MQRIIAVALLLENHNDEITKCMLKLVMGCNSYKVAAGSMDTLAMWLDEHQDQ